MSNNLVVLGQRGTTLWAFKRTKEDALTALLDDLLETEKSGLDDPQCDAIKKSIGHIVNWSTAIPDSSFFRKSISEVLKKFEDEYHYWNRPKGTDEKTIKHRHDKLNALRKLRQKVAKKARSHGHELEKELDLKLIEDVYKALGDVVSTCPEIFKNLSKAVSRFEKGLLR